MDTNRTHGLPPFPEGSDWADPASAFDDSAAGRAGRQGSLLVLWASVAAFALIAVVLLAADTAVYDGTNTEDTGPFDGLAGLAVVVFAVLFGAVPLVLAATQSVAAARRKTLPSRRTAKRVAWYTAGCGLVAAPYFALGTYQTAQDRRVTESALHEAYALDGTTALIGLLPLVLHVLLAAAARNAAAER